MFGDGGSGVDEMLVRVELRNRVLQEGVVGTAEDDGVSVDHGGDVLLDCGFYRRASEGSGFDEGDEVWAGLGDDLDVLGVGVQQAVELSAGEGGLSGENPDLAIGRDLAGGFDPWFHADDGNEVVGAEVLDTSDGGGVTGDDDELGSVLDEVVDEGSDAGVDLVV